MWCSCSAGLLMRSIPVPVGNMASVLRECVRTHIVALSRDGFLSVKSCLNWRTLAAVPGTKIGPLVFKPWSNRWKVTTPLEDQYIKLWGREERLLRRYRTSWKTSEQLQPANSGQKKGRPGSSAYIKQLQGLCSSPLDCWYNISMLKMTLNCTFFISSLEMMLIVYS